MNRKTNKGTEEKQVARRRQILDAAFECFLQYGFAKTSLDDVAKKADLSRPLLYLFFKNKEELFVETLRTMYQDDVKRAQPVLDLKVGKKEKLVRLYEDLLLKTWSRVYKAPNGVEFIAECHRYFPQLDKEYEKEVLKLLMPILEDKEAAEVLILCIDGLYSDNPTPAVLRKRIQLLAERFIR